MNNLVSKNPVQRFKQGRKILFAKWGDKAENPTPIMFPGTNEYYFGKWDGGNIIASSKLIRDTEQVRKSDEMYPFYDSYFYFRRAPYSIISRNKVLDSFYPLPLDRTGSYKATGTKPKTNYEIDKDGRVWVAAGPGDNSNVSAHAVGYINGGPKKNNGRKSRKTSKVSTPSSIFAGYKIGKTGGLNYNINDADKQQLIGTGQFTESDFKNAISTQQTLNRYFANSGLGSVTEDGAWGDQSRAALALALSKSKGLTPLNNETTIVKTPIVPAYTPSTTPINQEVSNLKLNVNVPQQTYDRTGVREFIRNKGINPYSFSVAQRRALRMVLNNTADDNDKLLVKGMGLFKQGGQLISKDPIKRFKNGGIQKFQNAGSLPTAPKAEDRYKNGVKDSVAYLGVPGKDNSYFGESIKRVTTPDNAAIQRQVLFRYYPYDNDTIYTEVPEHTKRFPILPPVNIIPRKGFSFAQTPEYGILKRRFNTAWNLAK